MTGGSGRPFPSMGEVDVAEILGRQPTVHHLRLHSAYANGRTGRCTQAADLNRPGLPRPVAHLRGDHQRDLNNLVDGRVVACSPERYRTWPFTDDVDDPDRRRRHRPASPTRALFPATMLVDWVSYSPN